MKQQTSAAAPLALLAAGCVFPAGPSLELADAAIRAHLGLVRRHPYCVDRCGIRFNCSLFPVRTEPLSRWQELANGAMRDLAYHLPQRIRPLLKQHAVPLWLVLPEADRPGRPRALDESLAELFQPNWAAIHIVRGGHTACALALEEAREWIQQYDLPAVLLAIDTPYAADTLMWLEQRNLVTEAHSPYRGVARANPYGRIPGEAAAALLIGPSHEPAWSLLAGLGIADEPLTFDTDGPCIGAGLTQAARAALQQGKTPPHAIADLIHDLNGEPYRADEFGFTSLRLSGELSPDYRRHVPALASGDVMTASLALHTAVAAWRHKGDSAAPPQLILSSSDDPSRAALLLHASVQEPSDVAHH